MPKNLTPEDRWETDFQVPLPGEPRNIGPLELLFQRLLNRTEKLKNRIAAILGLPWDATPPDTLAGLAGRVGALESSQGGTTLAAHRNALVLDHLDGSVTSEKIADGAVTPSKLAPGAAVANIGYTPVNRAGDTMSGSLTAPSLVVEGGANAVTVKEDPSDSTPGLLGKHGGVLYLSFASTKPLRVYRGTASGKADLEIFKDPGSGDLPVYLRFHQGYRHSETIKATNGLISFVTGDDTDFIGIQAKSLSGPNNSNLLLNARDWGVEIRIDEDNFGGDTFRITKGPNGSITLLVLENGGHLNVSGFMNVGGFNLSLGTADQSTRGDSGQSRALVKDHNATLVINYAGDFTGGVRVDGPGLTVTGDLTVNGTITGNFNASTATRLQTARTISLGGALSGSVLFDGAADVTINAGIRAGAVGTDHLADGAVTASKLAPGATPYDLAIFYPGTPSAGALLAAIATPRGFSLQGGSVNVGTAPAGDWTATIYDGGTAIGTVSVLAGQTTGTVSLNTVPTSLSAGALLRIVAPATADTAIRDISISLRGVV